MVASSHLFHYFEINEKYPGAWTNDLSSGRKQLTVVTNISLKKDLFAKNSNRDFVFS